MASRAALWIAGGRIALKQDNQKNEEKNGRKYKRWVHYPCGCSIIEHPGSRNKAQGSDRADRVRGRDDCQRTTNRRIMKESERDNEWDKEEMRQADLQFQARDMRRMRQAAKEIDERVEQQRQEQQL
ncbi:hypothetical protein VTN77DRAFT_8064 [Rasamsonia byssochlamydoides]|uniref:uncharacterized protein n=1 Tax=Rasamsonia byssochlamydoides TaxID=89139 RepID=UPI003742EE87